MTPVDTQLWLIVGLGNPGAEYEHTRHNAGFDCIDELAVDAGVRYWKTQGGALVGKGSLEGVPVVLAKPQSFMNASGGPVKALCAAYGVQPDHLVVIHDEMDLDPGTIRLKFGGGLAGHNGLKSINEKLGTPDWYRVRIGIGKPPGKMAGADYVLAVPRKEALEAHQAGIGRAREAVPCLLVHGLEKTQQRYHT